MECKIHSAQAFKGGMNSALLLPPQFKLEKKMTQSSSKPKRQRVAVIIIHQQKILLLYRYKNGRTYYVIPGGGIEPDESLEQTALREIKEETNLDISLRRKLWEYNNKGHLEHYFLAAEFSGTLQLGGPELAHQSPQNIYRPEWISLAQLARVPLLPEAIKDRIMAELMD
jgi:8-oxo-dGTP pyrophosphatase MutT (NUDIX family)